MRKLLLLFLFPAMLPVFDSCTRTEDICCAWPFDANRSVEGSWLLYEYGYSPGAGYITEPVSPVPPQIITFHSGNKITSSVDGWGDYKFYLILDDEYSDDKILALYKTDPGNPQDPMPYEVSYTLKYIDGDLFLYFRYCIEGCHLAFRKI